MNVKKNALLGIAVALLTHVLVHAASDTIMIKNNSGKNLYAAIYESGKEARGDTVTTVAIKKTDIKRIEKGETIKLDRPAEKNVVLLVSTRKNELRKTFNTRTRAGEIAFTKMNLGIIKKSDKNLVIVEDEDVKGRFRFKTQMDEDIEEVLERAPKSALEGVSKPVETFSPFGK